jgi:hypothetical protein
VDLYQLCRLNGKEDIDPYHLSEDLYKSVHLQIDPCLARQFTVYPYLIQAVPERIPEQFRWLSLEPRLNTLELANYRAWFWNLVSIPLSLASL